MKLLKIGIALSLALLLSVGGTVGGVVASAQELPSWDYEQDFEDVDSVNENFNAYYLTAFMGTLTREEVTETNEGNHFIVSDGILKRVNHVGMEYNADSLAMLYYTGAKYANFQMEVDILQGTATTFWTGFSIRTPSLGKHHFEEGQLFYLEWNGNLKTWGNGFHGGPFQCGSIENYSRSEWYTYLVTVDGNLMTISVRPSGAPVSEATELVIRIPWKFYQTGYVSLVSVNNDSQIRNFKIRGLQNTENIGVDVSDDQKIPPSGSDDDLDSLVSNINTGNTVQDVPKEDAATKDFLWLWILFGVVVGVAAVGAPVLWALRKRKNKKEETE